MYISLTNICLFFVVRKNFHSFGDITITVVGLKILTFTRHLWPLSSECSLTCHTGQPVIKVISEDPWHSHILPSVCQWSLKDFDLSRPGIEPRSPACDANALSLRGGVTNIISSYVWQIAVWTGLWVNVY